MKTVSQQYAALVTAWKSDEFFQARVQLTFFYTGILAVILFLFSSFLYVSVVHQFHSERYHPKPNPELVSPNIILPHEEVEKLFMADFGMDLALSNLLLLTVSALFGYFLAGKTLAPIKRKLIQHERFSHDVAHELRTPLAALYASVNATLRNKKLDSEARDTLTDVQTETRRLIEMTERLLHTAKSSEVLPHVPVRIDTVVKNVVAKLDALAKERCAMLSFTNTEELTVLGDAHQLEELFFNVIHNAIKFSRTNGSVEIAVLQNGNVTITDHGVGIETEKLSNVFDRFYTTDTSRDERGNNRGTGLGLAIVKDIARAHHAQVALSSEDGVGSVFTVHFSPTTS